MTLSSQMVISLIIAITNITLTIADLAFNIFFAKITHMTTLLASPDKLECLQLAKI